MYSALRRMKNEQALSKLDKFPLEPALTVQNILGPNNNNILHHYYVKNILCTTRQISNNIIFIFIFSNAIMLTCLQKQTSTKLRFCICIRYMPYTVRDVPRFFFFQKTFV